ncbi:uncharacterized protein [Triticum aestivum]|uniref:uncharacterized protein n=1 Tax=Triticum aestivum TaxID=4565 RepID=UPI001D024558|nr:uncharacterized protein LOC123056962 [Triticum aestivum]
MPFPFPCTEKEAETCTWRTSTPPWPSVPLLSIIRRSRGCIRASPESPLSPLVTLALVPPSLSLTFVSSRLPDPAVALSSSIPQPPSLLHLLLVPTGFPVVDYVNYGHSFDWSRDESSPSGHLPGHGRRRSSSDSPPPELPRPPYLVHEHRMPEPRIQTPPLTTTPTTPEVPSTMCSR